MILARISLGSMALTVKVHCIRLDGYDLFKR